MGWGAGAGAGSMASRDPYRGHTWDWMAPVTCGVYWPYTWFEVIPIGGGACEGSRWILSVP